MIQSISTTMTYGEAWYEHKVKSMETNANDYGTLKMRYHKPRMGRKQAVQYYKEKISNYFSSLKKTEQEIALEDEAIKAIKKVRCRTKLLLSKEAKKIKMVA